LKPGLIQIFAAVDAPSLPHFTQKKHACKTSVQRLTAKQLSVFFTKTKYSILKHSKNWLQIGFGAQTAAIKITEQLSDITSNHWSQLQCQVSAQNYNVRKQDIQSLV